MQRHNERAITLGLVAAALGQLGFEIEDVDDSEYGADRYFTVAISTRADYPFDESLFSFYLNEYNKASGFVKPGLYRVEEYPAKERNFIRYYITVVV